MHEKTASADKEVAEKYFETFRQILKERGYKLEHVFIMGETGLFWKKIPSKTYNMRDETRVIGFKELKGKVTLIMCGNVAGFMVTFSILIPAFISTVTFFCFMCFFNSSSHTGQALICLFLWFSLSLTSHLLLTQARRCSLCSFDSVSLCICIWHLMGASRCSVCSASSLSFCCYICCICHGHVESPQLRATSTGVNASWTWHSAFAFELSF